MSLDEATNVISLCFLTIQKDKMMKILDKLYQKIGHEEKSDPIHFDSSLKQEIARWACVFESYKCRKQDYFKLSTHLLQKDKSLLPWWKEWTYCNGLLGAENVTWNEISATKIGMEYFILLFKSLLFLCAATLATDENSGNNDRLTYSRGTLPDNVIPLKYEVNLELNATYSNISFRGNYNISILVNRPTRNISFHADSSQVQELRNCIIRHSESTTIIYYLSRNKPTYNNDTDIYTCFFDEELSGYYNLYLMLYKNVENSNKVSIFRTSFI
ncbi:hypothetical protein DBV15_11321 [Temnothorax longispinosus]|uniref:Aminopeptidase N n=1 Tax=Temnothorax longispinosus TaxID=300112 RepID=A0A4S2JN76_9HYME|nr:hypothetical protein DBV15_11321 [Temnothorax longispinosus]